MLFNSVDFAIFLPVVFLLYWFFTRKNLTLQNALLVIASYVFYGWWDWRFLGLILFSSLVDYTVGRGLAAAQSPGRRKALLMTSVLVNIGFLGFFKYFNFFSESFADAFTLFGASFDPVRLNIVLPVGISFYTFQTLSYTIDVYRKQLEPTRDIVSFLAFVSFFPQLVAGPIERASNLLPQFHRRRTFDYARAADGLRQILWGLVKKLVIADNCAAYANIIFNDTGSYEGSTLVLGAVLFAFQIYGDFSGYSDIAIGTARLFGFDLMKNFAFPYFSRDIAEFWRRWHISLSTWFRDYLYIPLGGSKRGVRISIRNVFVIFLVSGFWHGANWTFIIWGGVNALYFLPLMLLGQNRRHLGPIASGRVLPTARESLSVLLTFALTVFAWIFFRAADLGHAGLYIERLTMGLFAKSGYVETLNFLYYDPKLYIVLILVAIFLVVEWAGRNCEYAIERWPLRMPVAARWAFYYLMLYAIGFLSGSPQEFIYFQF